ncbi:aminodeoxychorismate synthase component I [Nostoc parmelioides]|uniref:aminodeoxychorismate synthase n=1 Tax=Nostoc parmelioides FACHB-3921 TaxID=2692909 RepID=A0ABR8BH34_9NOSO|nr:aminodeoxychorismate synthase component I [Nostoc parmelioides]MBD2252026.1 aminodeoxychorismate synthase component I [Nostoc parmelioides FACHB-3921]
MGDIKTLIIDNYDSYTFNLYQMIAEVNGELPLVIHNDKLDWYELKQLVFDNIVISPGPGRPENLKDFGICQQILQHYLDVPLLGVCLGHQGIGHYYGGKIIHAPEPQHGRLSHVYHSGGDLFQEIPTPFSVVRYHSLLVAEELPSCLEKVAWTEDGLVMGLRHRHLPLWGVQFHPESICSEYGYKLLENFQGITEGFIRQNGRPRPKLESKIFSISTNSPTPAPPQEFTVCSQKLDYYPDTEQAFVHLFGEYPHAFWLDSSLVEPGLSRFSFMGGSGGINSLLVSYCTQSQELTITQSGEVTRTQENIFDYLKREINRRRCPSDELPFDFNCGFVGYFGYELKAESGSELEHPSSFPDAILLLSDRLIAFDHQEQTTYLVYLAPVDQIASAKDWFELTEKRLRTLPPLPPLVPSTTSHPVTFRLSRSYQTYKDDISRCLKEIREGETYQVCLTNRLCTDTTADPLAFYRRLRQVNPAPYSAFLRFGEMAIACSSPERFLQIDRQGWVETKPIKGTVRRGETPEEDFLLRESLRSSEKERAENLMIVDLLRNDLGRVCQVGSIHVPKLMDVESYATVHQLVSTIRGLLSPDMDATDCIRMAFPGGSMTGAPKLRTMEIIDQLEQEARGVYSGAIGFLGVNGTADLNIVIRTAVLTPNQTSIGIGGGIVALSDVEMEFQETILKADALIQAMLLTVHGEYHPSLYRILGMPTEVFC